MPVGNIRKLRPVHQFLKSDSNDEIILDKNGVVQNVTEDFDDNDVVDTKHLIPTHMEEFNTLLERDDHDTTAWLRGDIAVVDAGDSATNRSDTGTYIYVGTDQDIPAGSDNDDWLLLASAGQFNLSNQFIVWNPLTDYFIGDQVVFNGKMYTVSSLNFPNTATGTVVIPGNASNENPEDEIANTNPNDSSDRADWAEGFATRIQGVRADSSIQPAQLLKDNYSHDGNILGAKVEYEVLETPLGTEETTSNLIFTVDVTTKQDVLDQPTTIVDPNNNTNRIVEDNPKRIFLKFNPNNLAYKTSTISYADLEESPAVFKFVFENTAARNANLDFLGEADEDGNKVAYPEGTLDEDKDGTIDIIWVTGDQVIVSEDTFNNDVLLSSKGAYVYVADTQSTAVVTVDDDWQFVGINTLAETAVQSITIGDATEALLETNGNVTIPADQIKAAYESVTDTNTLTDIRRDKIDFLTVTAATDLNTMRSNVSDNNAKIGFTDELARDALAISDNDGVLTYKDSSDATQTLDTKTDISGKVDIDGDKVLSDNNFTDANVLTLGSALQDVDTALKYNVLLTGGFLFNEGTTPENGRTPYTGTLITDDPNTTYYFDSSDDGWYSAAAGGTKLIGF